MSTFNDKHAIVLDVGVRYVKSGVSDERAPRCVLRWELRELLAKRVDIATLRAYLASQLRRICFDLMHVNPRHRRFLLCEDVVGPRAVREAVVDVLFTDLKAASVALVPAAVAALFATSHHSALVVDCGYDETRVLPIFKGIPLLHYFTSVGAGTASCCRELEQRLAASEPPPPPPLSIQQTEDALERACFVQPLQNRLMDVADATFRQHAAQSLVIPASMRSDACENLFVGTETSSSSVVTCLEELLHKLPIDVRAAMAGNILLIGGTAMLPGFSGRLKEELAVALEADKQRLSEHVDVVRARFPSNMLVWVGASILAGAELVNESTISANEYASSGPRSLPDWTSVAETEI